MVPPSVQRAAQLADAAESPAPAAIPPDDPRHDPAGQPLGTGAWLALGLLVFGIAAVPFLATQFPPLYDYANHLSRVTIIARWAEMPELHPYFDLGTLRVPNVVPDLIGVALAKVMDPVRAGQAMLLLVAATIFSGAVALGRAMHGRWTVAPFAAALLLVNENLSWGFVNYLMGVGFLLWAVTSWAWFDRRSRAAQLALGFAWGALLYFSHLVVFGLYAIVVAVIELRRAWLHRGTPGPALRRLVVSATPFLPAVYFYLSSPTRGLNTDMLFNFSLKHKLAPFSRLLSTGNEWTDLGLPLAVLALVAVAALRREVTVSRRLALCVLVLVPVYWELPHGALQSFFLDSRVAVVIVLLALLSLGYAPRTRQAGMAALGIVLALVAVRSADVTWRWDKADREYAEIVAALDAIPRGSLLVGIVNAPPEHATTWTQTRRFLPPHHYTASYGTIRRAAFVPAIYAKAGQNPLVLTAEEAGRFRLRYRFFYLWHLEDLRGLIGDTAGLRRALEPQPVAAYVLALRVNCDEWLWDAPAEVVHCGSNFVLARAKGE